MTVRHLHNQLDPNLQKLQALKKFESTLEFLWEFQRFQIPTMKLHVETSWISRFHLCLVKAWTIAHPVIFLKILTALTSPQISIFFEFKLQKQGGNTCTLSVWVDPIFQLSYRQWRTLKNTDDILQIENIKLSIVNCINVLRKTCIKIMVLSN